MKLGAFDYVIEHLPGEQNVWADMVTRWVASSQPGIEVKNKSGLKALLQAPIRLEKDDLDWPSQAKIVRIQRQFQSEVPPKALRQDGVWKLEDATWIPRMEKALKQKIMIAGHFGLSGHRGAQTTIATMKKVFR